MWIHAPQGLLKKKDSVRGTEDLMSSSVRLALTTTRLVVRRAPLARIVRVGSSALDLKAPLMMGIVTQATTAPGRPSTPRIMTIYTAQPPILEEDAALQATRVLLEVPLRHPVQQASTAREMASPHLVGTVRPGITVLGGLLHRSQMAQAQP